MRFTLYCEPTLYTMKHSYVCSDINYVTNVKFDFTSSILRCTLDPRLTSVAKVHFHSHRQIESIVMAEADTGVALLSWKTQTTLIGTYSKVGAYLSEIIMEVGAYTKGAVSKEGGLWTMKIYEVKNSARTSVTNCKLVRILQCTSDL